MHEKKLTPKERLAFERARFEYCAKIYEGELGRKEILEKRAEFYLSFVTLFLGAVFLKLDTLSTLRDLAARARISSAFLGILYVSMISLALSLLISLIAILASMRLQEYRAARPANLISSLFAPDSKYLDTKDEPSLLGANAMTCAIAFELNTDVNNRKARWIQISGFGVFAAVISLGAVVTVVIHLSIFA